jgi:hypothetical protein
VKVVICSGGRCPGTGSSCEAWRTGSGEVRVATRSEFFGRPACAETPGSVLVQGLETTTGPFFGSNRAIKVILRSGPLTSSHGSQKL